MATEIAAAYVSILPSGRNMARNLSSELRGPARQAGREAGDALEEGLAGGANRGSQRAGQAIGGLLAGGAVLAGLNKVRDAASDLQQSVGGTGAVFGEAAGQIDEFAQNAAESVGLSERAAREATSKIGALFKGFGFAVDDAADKAIELTGIGADLAATFGGTTTEAVDALAAALRGETDPIERYGISLRQASIGAEAMRLGLADSVTNVDANARATAALSLITDQAADSMGTFAAESDTAAGSAQIAGAKAEDAAASLGDALLPISTKVAEAIGFIADAFAALPAGVQTGLVALLGITAVAGPVSNVLGLYRSLVPAVSAATVASEANTAAMVTNAAATNSAATVNGLYAVSAGRAATGARILSTAAGAAAAALGGVTLGVSLVSIQNQRAASQGSALADQFTNELRGARSYEEFLGITNQRISEFNALIDDASSGLDIFHNHSLNEAAKEIDDVIGSFQGLNDVISAYANEGLGTADEATQTILGHLDEVNAMLAEGATAGAVAQQVEQIAAAEATAQQAAIDNADALDTLGTAASETATGFGRLNDELDDNIRNMRDAFDVATSASEAQLSFRDTLRSIVDQTAAVADGTLTGAERVDAFRHLLLQGRDDALDYAEALLDTGSSAEEAADGANTLIDELFETADQAGLTASEVAFLRAEYQLLPEEVETRIESNIGLTLDQVVELRNQLAALGGAAVADVNTTLRGPHAHTGAILPGLSLVGEKGPEILALDRPGFMWSTRDSAAMFAGMSAGGGGTIVQNVTGKPDNWTLAQWEAAGKRGAAVALDERSMALAGG